MTILRPRNQDFAAVGWLAAFAMLHGVVWAAGDRSGDVDRRYPKETVIQHGGPVYAVTQPPDGRRAAKGDGVEAGRSKVEGLGKLIAAHVLARPSTSVLRLLPGLP